MGFDSPTPTRYQTDNRNEGKIMDKTHQGILDMYRLMLKHYQVKGIGAYSDLSKNTKITPTLIRSILDRYIQLGGDSDFSDITDEKYKEFLIEMKG